jgi:hypothetical protein
MFKDSRKDILIHDITKDLDFLLLAHVGQLVMKVPETL